MLELNGKVFPILMFSFWIFDFQKLSTILHNVTINQTGRRYGLASRKIVTGFPEDAGFSGLKHWWSSSTLYWFSWISLLFCFDGVHQLESNRIHGICGNLRDSWKVKELTNWNFIIRYKIYVLSQKVSIKILPNEVCVIKLFMGIG